MKHVLFLALTVFFFFLFQNISAQGGGYLGNKFQVQANFSPTLGYSFYSQSETDISEHVLFGGRRGTNNLTGYYASNISFHITMSRRSTLGLQLGRQKYLSEYSIDLGQYFASGYVPLMNNTVELIYQKYSGITPVKRYWRYALGMSISVVKDSNYDLTVPYLAVGFGGNEFLSDKIYINYGLDINIYLIAIGNEAYSSNPGARLGHSQFGPISNLRRSNLFELNLGIGVNL